MDIVSCQFALHYSFESLEQTETIIRNVSENLRKGGYFIATIPDANEIVWVFSFIIIFYYKVLINFYDFSLFYWNKFFKKATMRPWNVNKKDSRRNILLIYKNTTKTLLIYTQQC